MSAASLPDVTDDTFAQYLARFYTLKRGFVLGTVPEAQALTSACDFVLTQSDGLQFAIVCIIDRERNPSKHFGIAPDELRQIAERCLKYAGMVNRQKMPITISVIEVGASVDAETERDRLRAYKRKSIFSKGVLVAWLIDVSSKSVWANSAFRGGFARRTFESLLRKPRETDEVLTPPQVELVNAGRPWVTWSLIAALIAIFSCEIVYRIGWGKGLLAPDIPTLLAFGGLQRELVVNAGEWFRVFTAPLLHADLFHIAMNGICLFLAGTVVERTVGRTWLLGVFVLGALAGSLMSIAINPADMVSVGASGAIMALLAFAFVSTFRFPASGRLAVQMPLLQVLIPSLVPLATTAGHRVDFAAHCGGALAGAFTGLLLIMVWRRSESRPPGTWWAAAMALCGLVALAIAIVPLRESAREYRLASMLIPAEALPKTDEAAKAASVTLLAGYPEDPRSHLYRAAALIAQNELQDAETELRTSLQKLDAAHRMFKPGLRELVSTNLAALLAFQGRTDEARRVASAAGLNDWQPPSPPEPLRVRSQSEIDTQLSEASQATGAIFRNYFHNSRARAGVLTLEFTVAPNGTVGECHAISSTYNDPTLEQPLAEVIRGLRFSANDPRDKTSYKYTVTFGREKEAVGR